MNPLQLTTSEVSVEVSYAYRPHEFRAAAALLGRHRELFAALVTSERPLQDTESAFDALAAAPDEIKILRPGRDQDPHPADRGAVRPRR